MHATGCAPRVCKTSRSFVNLILVLQFSARAPRKPFQNGLLVSGCLPAPDGDQARGDYAQRRTCQDGRGQPSPRQGLFYCPRRQARAFQRQDHGPPRAPARRHGDDDAAPGERAQASRAFERRLPPGRHLPVLREAPGRLQGAGQGQGRLCGHRDQAQGGSV